MNYELHPLCTLFPRITGAEFDSLVEDVRANGLRQPITLHEGMILDGGNRYRACLAAGVEPAFKDFDGGNIVSFVLSANLHRRHLSAGQQAAIVASAQDWAKAQTVGRPEKSVHVNTFSDTTESRAAQSGASVMTQRRADAVAKADPDLIKEVGLGNVSLPKAVAKVAPQLAPRRAALEPEPANDDAHLSDDELLADLQRENEELRALVAAAEADDQTAEAVKWRRAYENAKRAQSEAMDSAAESQKRERWTMNQLRRCGRVVDEDDPRKIAAAVEAAVRRATA